MIGNNDGYNEVKIGNNNVIILDKSVITILANWALPARGPSNALNLHFHQQAELAAESVLSNK